MPMNKNPNDLHFKSRNTTSVINQILRRKNQQKKI